MSRFRMPPSRLLYFPRRQQWLWIAGLLLFIAIAHNSIPVPGAGFLMTLTQDLFFIPVMLAGFWFGLAGGLLTAAIAAVLFPHYGLGHGLHASIFSLELASSIALLFLVGGITGWLRDQLSAELERHRSTAEQRDQALKEVKQSYEQAQQAERMAALGQMAAGIAHEVRNPLTSMQGAADILKRSVLEHPQRAAQLIERLQNEITHLEEITRHFLEFARPPQANMRQVKPCNIVQESVEVLRPEAQQRGLTLDCQVVDKAHYVHGDRDQLRQIIVNLLLNAIQFAEGGSEINIRSGFEAGQWRLAVSNRGPEIPAEEQERIFEPFFTTRAEGTGLGLAISARIAEAHHGRLQCNRKDGITTFILSVPESPDAASDPDHR